MRTMDLSVDGKLGFLSNVGLLQRQLAVSQRPPTRCRWLPSVSRNDAAVTLAAAFRRHGWITRRRFSSIRLGCATFVVTRLSLPCYHSRASPFFRLLTGKRPRARGRNMVQDPAHS